MKAAIIGYGKMGREIERILTERGHEAVPIIEGVDVIDDIRPGDKILSIRIVEE